MGRIIGVDYGSKRIGLAVTDPLKMFASPLTTVSPSEFDNFIKDYLKESEIEAFVIGYPVKMNNEPGETVNFINLFIKKLKKTYPEKRIYLEDERFTSQMALRIIVDGGVKKMNRRDKSIVDKISASIILQSFLDKRTSKRENI